MLVKELVAKLSDYDDDTPVMAYTIEGGEESIVAVEDNESDSPDVHPRIVYLILDEH